MSRAQRIAEIQEQHRRVHEALNRDVWANPLDYVYLIGVEEALDWVMQSCPHGDANWDGKDIDLEPPYKFRLAIAYGDEHEHEQPVVRTLATPPTVGQAGSEGAERAPSRRQLSSGSTLGEGTA